MEDVVIREYHGRGIHGRHEHGRWCRYPTLRKEHGVGKSRRFKRLLHSGTILLLFFNVQLRIDTMVLYCIPCIDIELSRWSVQDFLRLIRLSLSAHPYYNSTISSSPIFKAHLPGPLSCHDAKLFTEDVVQEIPDGASHASAPPPILSNSENFSCLELLGGAQGLNLTSDVTFAIEIVTICSNHSVKLECSKGSPTRARLYPVLG